jgi:hypothetical protein
MNAAAPNGGDGNIRSAQRELLYNAIEDIQGSIHANDNKSSAGLVVHGLLVTGILALSSGLGELYGKANDTAQTVIKYALGGALVLLFLSVVSLLVAISPYAARRYAKRLPSSAGYRRVFFPDARKLKKAKRGAATNLLADLRDLDSNDRLEEQLIGELVLLAQIRYHEAWWARLGFFLLGLEVCCGVAYLGMIGRVAAGEFREHTPAPAHAAAIEWSIKSTAYSRRLPAANAIVVLGAPRRVTATLLTGSHDGVRQANVSVSLTYTCRRRATRRTMPATPPRVVARQLGARAGIRRPVRVPVQALLRRRHCPRGMRYAGATLRLDANVVTRRHVARHGSLTVHARR